MDLADAQWEILQPVFVESRRSDGRGRPWRDAREVLLAVAVGGGQRHVPADGRDGEPVDQHLDVGVQGIVRARAEGVGEEGRAAGQEGGAAQAGAELSVGRVRHGRHG